MIKLIVHYFYEYTIYVYSHILMYLLIKKNFQYYIIHPTLK